MTAFVFNSSPERQRIENAGYAFLERKEEAAREKERASAKLARLRKEARMADAAREAEHTTREVATMRTINVEVCRQYGIFPTIIRTSARSRLVSAARREIFWRCRNELGRTYTEIGRHFDHDHTSVIWACRKYDEMHNG